MIAIPGYPNDPRFINNNSRKPIINIRFEAPTQNRAKMLKSYSSKINRSQIVGNRGSMFFQGYSSHEGPAKLKEGSGKADHVS